MQKLCLALAIILIFCTNAKSAPPDDCVRQISEAIETENAAAFEQAVDIDSLLNSSLDTFIRQLQKTSTPLGPVLPMLLSQINTSAGQTIKNLFLQEAKAYLINGVNSGSFAGRRPNGTPSQGLLAPLLVTASTGRKEIRGSGEPVADADGWLMPFSLHDYGNGSEYIIIGRFKQTDNGTRLIGIKNLEQILEQIDREREAN